MKIILSEQRRRGGAAGPGFTLLEVMIAAAIFFTAVFALLQLTTMSLDSARALQHYEPDAAMLAAQFTAISNVAPNQLKEEQASGDFGDAYPGYAWTSDCYQVSSNHLWEVDFTVSKGHGRKTVSSQMSIYLLSPQSPETMPKGSLQ
jgi:Tfp pilus assembly protein PilV